MRRCWTKPETIQRLLALRASGASFKSIGAALGIHPATAAHIAQRNGAAKIIVRDGGTIAHRFAKAAGLPTRDPAILAYRRAKKARQKRLAPVLREAKQELERAMALAWVSKGRRSA